MIDINSFDEITKAQRASVGEIRVWSDGKKYIKTPKGWVLAEGQRKVKALKNDDIKNKYWILTSYDNSKAIKDKLKKSFDYTLPGNSETDKGQSLTVFSSESSLLVPKDTTNLNIEQQFMDEIIEKAKKSPPKQRDDGVFSWVSTCSAQRVFNSR